MVGRTQIMSYYENGELIILNICLMRNNLRKLRNNLITENMYLMHTKNTILSAVLYHYFQICTSSQIKLNAHNQKKCRL